MTLAEIRAKAMQEPMTAEQREALEAYFASITPETVTAPKPASELPTAELEAELAQIVAHKAWSNPRYYEVDRELQNRYTRRWVHDDVFGNTFAPLTGSHN
jgi:hypothetical protein